MLSIITKNVKTMIIVSVCVTIFFRFLLAGQMSFRPLLPHSVIFAVLCVQSAVAVCAQVGFEEEVLSGTQSDMSLISDEVVHTEIISKSALRLQHASDIQQALKYANGVLLRDIHGKTGQTAWVQGFSGEHVLVLVDGHRVTATTGSGVDLSQLSVNNIERIEITKGAGSALYGSQAIGGVINIITANAVQGFHGGAKLEVGQYTEHKRPDGRELGHVNAGFNLRYAQPLFALDLAGDKRDTDGFYVPAEQAYQSTFGQMGYKSNYSVGVAVTPSPQHRAKLSHKVYKESHRTPLYTLIPGLGVLQNTKTEQVQSDHTALAVNLFQGQRHSVAMDAFVEQFTDHTRHAVNRDAKINTAEAKLSYQYELANQDTLILGGAYTSDKLAQLNNGASELSQSQPHIQAREYFTQYDHWFGEHTQMLLGLRHHQSDEHGQQSLPKFSLLHYRPFNQYEQKIRLNYGQGYRLPTIKDQYYVFDHSVYGYKVLGDSALVPERSHNVQLGYEINDAQGNRLNINAFYNRIEHLISSEFTGIENGILIYKKTNINSAQTQGVELSAHKKLFNILQLDMAYTHLIAKNTSAGEYHSKDLSKRPEHLFKLRLTGHVLNNTGVWSVGGVYEGAQYINASNSLKAKGYTVWDAKYTHTLSPELKAFFGVDNLTNTYKTPNVATDLRPSVGRYVYTGLEYVF